MKKRQQATASLSFERDLIAQGYRCIVGIDEAGRGAWAGPVVCRGGLSCRLNAPDLCQRPRRRHDSKQLTARARESLIDRIKATALAWGVGSAEADEIDALGIVPATCLAMRRAVDHCSTAPALDPDYLLLDLIRWRGFPDKHIDYQAVVRGDSLSLSIAAASMLAKVARDAWMVEYDAAVSAVMASPSTRAMACRSIRLPCANSARRRCTA